MGAVTGEVAARVLRPGEEAIAAEACRRVDGEVGEPTQIADFLARSDHFAVVGFLDGEPAGYCVAHLLGRIDGRPPKLFVYSVDVAKRYRRRGVGRAMIECLKALARTTGARSTWMITNEANTAAMRLYESTGGKREMNDDVVWAYSSESGS